MFPTNMRVINDITICITMRKKRMALTAVHNYLFLENEIEARKWYYIYGFKWHKSRANFRQR